MTNRRVSKRRTRAKDLLSRIAGPTLQQRADSARAALIHDVVDQDDRHADAVRRLKARHKYVGIVGTPKAKRPPPPPARAPRPLVDPIRTLGHPARGRRP